MEKIERQSFKTVQYQKVIVHDADTNAIIGTGYAYWISKDDMKVTEHFMLNKLFDTDQILEPGNYRIEFDNGFGIAIIPARIQ